MFCPNCASRNESTQHYCRACGLKLDAIVANVAAQRPSKEFERLLARKRKFETLGFFSVSVAGIIGFSLLIAGAFYYKLQIFGPELLFRSASIALVVFALASIFFFNYPKFAMRFDRIDPNFAPEEEDQPRSGDTNKLLSDAPFEPASVTEHSTELLKSRK